MTHNTSITKSRKGCDRTFPWPCGNCLKDEVYPERMPYAVDVKHDGQLYHLEISDLKIPKCRACGELVFSNSVDDQILYALRTHLRLLNPEQIRGGREALGLKSKELAEKLGVAAETISRWERGGLIQSRAMDNFLRVFFAVPEARAVLRGADQHPDLGTDTIFGKENKCMNYVTCLFCGTTAPESEFCPACGKPRKKWCPQCEEWKSSKFSSLEVYDGTPLDQSMEEATFCGDCGAELGIPRPNPPYRKA